MNEIERAIDHFEDFLKNMRCHETLLVPEAIPSHELALKLLRAELTRQENAPLTLEELSKLASSDPVWGAHCFVKDVYTGKVFQALVDVDSTGIAVLIGSNKKMDIYEYGRKWIAYRYEPKGESK